MRVVVCFALLYGPCLLSSAAPGYSEIRMPAFSIPVMRDYVEIIKFGKVYQQADAPLQEVLLSIAHFATSHSGLSELELLALPDIQSKEEKSLGSELIVRTVDGDGVRTVYYYDRNCNSLYHVQSQSATDGYTDVWFTRDRKATEQTLGLGEIRSVDSEIAWQVDFHEGINQPRMAFPYSKNKKTTASEGKVIGWDTAGNTVFDLPVPDAPPYDVKTMVLGQLTTEQLDAMNILPKSRMVSTRGYREANKDLQRILMALAGEAERHADLRTDGLQEAFGSEKLEIVEGANYTVYALKSRQRSDVSAVFDRASGRLRCIEKDKLIGAYFAYQGHNRLFGGYYTMDHFRSAAGFGLVSIYSGRLSPRLALLHVDRATSLCVVDAEVLVWDPAGAILVQIPVVAGISVEAVLRDIQDKLTDTQKEEIGWQGAGAELMALLGTL